MFVLQCKLNFELHNLSVIYSAMRKTDSLAWAAVSRISSFISPDLNLANTSVNQKVSFGRKMGCKIVLARRYMLLK